MKLLALFLAIAVAAAQAGTVKRDADTAVPSLQDIVSQAEQHMATFASTVQSLFTPGEEQKATLAKVGETLTNQTQELAARVQTLVNNLNQAVKEGQNNQGLQEVADRLNGTLRQLLGEDNASEAERASAQLSENVKNAVQTVVEEASKISKSVDAETAPLREELGAATRTAIAQALDVADYLQQQLQQAIGGAQPAAAT